MTEQLTYNTTVVFADVSGSSKLYKEVGSPQSYLIVSEWNDEAAFNAFIRSEAFAKVTNWGKEQILSGRPKHQIYVNK